MFNVSLLKPAFLVGSLAPTADTPRAEAIVDWLLEHQDLQLPDLSDSESSDVSVFSDSDSVSDDYEDMEGAGADIALDQTEVII